MKDLDCYIYIDYEVPEEIRTISVLCQSCHDEKMPDTGFFYEGSKEGYSDYDWQCCICNKYIHRKHGGADEEEKS